MKSLFQKLVLPFAALLSGVLQFIAYPNVNMAEAAYVFAVPLLLLAMAAAPWKRFLLWAFLGNWFSWIGLLCWLRHVTLPGMIMLAATVACIPTLWFMMARWVLPEAMKGRFITRLGSIFLLAVAWSALEWVREWLFSGFPWGPLALTQWQHPLILQPAAFGGSHLVSFILVFFNLGLAVFFWRLVRRNVSEDTELSPAGFFKYRSRSLTSEFCLSLIPILSCVVYFTTTIPKAKMTGFTFRAGVVQPYNPSRIYFDKKLTEEERRRKFVEDAQMDWSRIAQHTALFQKDSVDVILWPEAAPPVAVLNKFNDDMRREVEYVSRQVDLPVLTGAMTAVEKGMFNGIMVVNPDTGVDETFYAKRHLVPFGEYIPKWLRILPFINAVIPIAGDFDKGDDPRSLALTIKGEKLLCGGLVCYEDVFADLALETMQSDAPADFFYVATNNAWYGEESGAYQHAAHAVLRAVENRRPVIRCGNGGWSGWIDEWGCIRETMENGNGNVYFRGIGTLHVTIADEWRNQCSFFVRGGSWFGFTCGMMTIAWLGVRFINERRKRKHKLHKQAIPSHHTLSCK